MSRIRLSTALLRRLGEELNPTIERGILELAKNAYDADATTCVITLKNTHKKNGIIRVFDDGAGMSPKEIEESWLVLGSSSKKKKKRTPKFRRTPAGSKGLGRLAALRMGRYADLVTSPEGNNFVYSLPIDWDKFDKARLVDDVVLKITTKERKRAVGGTSQLEMFSGDDGTHRTSHGTTINLRGLRDSVGRMEVKRLARELLLLSDPFKEVQGAFKAVLVAPEFQDLEKLVSNSYFDHADYHLVASLKDGKASAKVVDFRGNILFQAKHKDLISHRQLKKYSAPQTTFDFWTFILQKESFASRPVSVQEVRAWLEQFGGVHLYDEDIRVHPYGNPGNDWLDLNLRRAQSPEERPSTNNSIGRVRITDLDEMLFQKTDRSGFVESETFIQLRWFCQDVLDWMARRRLEEAQERRKRTKALGEQKVSKTKLAIRAAIDALPLAKKPQFAAVFQKYDESRDQEVQTLKQDVQLYRTLSTAGITAATFAHESGGSPIKTISTSIRSIEKRAKHAIGDAYASTLEKPVQSIISATESLSVLSNATLKLVDHEKRRIGRIEPIPIIAAICKTFKPFLDERRIEVHLTETAITPYLRGSEAAVESVITNLLNNSISALEGTHQASRDIWISYEIENGMLLIRFGDNGPGIKAKIKDIWLPGFSTKPNGTGLGLAIVRDSVADLGGSVDARSSGPYGGAEFTVSLPILGVGDDNDRSQKN